MDEQSTTLVVGADSDIGSNLICRLSGNVIAHYYAFPDKLEGMPESVIPVFGDLSSEDGIAAFIDEADGKGFAVERIVHLPSAPAAASRFRDFDAARFKKGFNIQFISAALIFKRFVPPMAKRRYGRVVSVLTSYCIGVPPKYLSEYVSSKYALMGLVKALAAEYAPSGVTFNAVAPSMVDTKFLSTLPDFEIAASAKANPTGRNATTDDVAAAIDFLLRDSCGYITGAVLPVTGGSAF